MIYIIKLIITNPPIWTNLQIFSHLNNSQNKVLCYWKEEDIVNLKQMSYPTVYKWSFISPNFIKCVIFHIKFLLCLN